MKKAFTLIEIIFVLIVVGILAAIGSDILFKAYENYIITKTLSSASYKTDVALQLIAKRLEQRIPFSEISIKDKANKNIIAPLGSSDTDHKIIAWISRASEAARGEYNSTMNFNYPGWSGFIDLGESNKTQIVTKGSNLTIAKDIIKALTQKDLFTQNNGTAITFQYYPINRDNIRAYGWKYAITGSAADKPTAIFAVHAADAKTLVFDDVLPNRLYEHYYMAHTAYAIVPEATPEGDYNLTLYYNFRPWMGEEFTDGQNRVLVSGVTKFTFKRVARSIELRLCARSRVHSDFNITICGKKVVF